MPESHDHPASSSAQPGPSVAPMSDEQSRAEVVDPARQIVTAANLEVTYATFAWESCNDQGDPPYHGVVDIAYVVPEGVDRQALSKQVAAAAAGLPGWAAGPPPDLHPYGDLAHKGEVMVIAGVGNYPDRNQLQVVGNCRNTNDHRGDNGVKDITGEIRG
jgi:hypothetical protein